MWEVPNLTELRVCRAWGCQLGFWLSPSSLPRLVADNLSGCLASYSITVIIVNHSCDNALRISQRQSSCPLAHWISGHPGVPEIGVRQAVGQVVILLAVMPVAPRLRLDAGLWLLYRSCQHMILLLIISYINLTDSYSAL